MIIFLFIIVFMIASTALVIAAGMLSSRLSRQEDWAEEYESEQVGSTDSVLDAID